MCKEKVKQYCQNALRKNKIQCQNEGGQRNKAGFTPFRIMIYYIFFGFPFYISIGFFAYMIDSLKYRQEYKCSTNIKELTIFMSILNILIPFILGGLYLKILKYISSKDLNKCNKFARFLVDNKLSYLQYIITILSIVWLIICDQQLEKELTTSNCLRPQFQKAFQLNRWQLFYFIILQLCAILISLFFAKKDSDCFYFLKCWLFYFSFGICYSEEFPPISFENNEIENQQTNRTKNQQNLQDNQIMDNPPQILIPETVQS